MKKLTTIATMTTIILSLSACSNQDNADNDNITTTTQSTQTGTTPNTPDDEAKNKESDEPDATDKKEEEKTITATSDQKEIADVINKYIELTSGVGLEEKDFDIDYTKDNAKKLAKNSGITDLFNPDNIDDTVETNLGIIMLETELNHRISKEMMGEEYIDTEEFKQSPNDVVVDKNKAKANNEVELVKKDGNWYMEIPESLKTDKTDNLEELKIIKQAFEEEKSNNG